MHLFLDLVVPRHCLRKFAYAKYNRSANKYESFLILLTRAEFCYSGLRLGQKMQ